MKRTNFVTRTVIVISIATTSLSGCILAVAGVGAEAGYLASQDDRSAKETVADQLIVSAVKAKLVADSEVPGFDINVDSFRGKVTLRGALQKEEQVSKALELAQKVQGVKEVESKLVVVP